MKKCFFRMASVALRARDDERLGVVLAAVVGDGRQVADVIEVRVADEHGLERALGLELHAARQRAGVDGDAVVDDERARPVLRGLAAVAADDAEIHGLASSPRTFAASRGTP